MARENQTQTQTKLIRPGIAPEVIKLFSILYNDTSEMSKKFIILICIYRNKIAG